MAGRELWELPGKELWKSSPKGNNKMGNRQKQPFQHWKLTKGMEQMEKHVFKKIYKTLVRMVGIYGLLARSCCHIPLSYMEPQFHRARQAVRTCNVTPGEADLTGSSKIRA